MGSHRVGHFIVFSASLSAISDQVGFRIRILEDDGRKWNVSQYLFWVLKSLQENFILILITWTQWNEKDRHPGQYSTLWRLQLRCTCLEWHRRGWEEGWLRFPDARRVARARCSTRPCSTHSPPTEGQLPVPLIQFGCLSLLSLPASAILSNLFLTEQPEPSYKNAQAMSALAVSCLVFFHCIQDIMWAHHFLTLVWFLYSCSVCRALWSCGLHLPLQPWFPSLSGMYPGHVAFPLSLKHVDHLPASGPLYLYPQPPWPQFFEWLPSSHPPGLSSVILPLRSSVTSYLSELRKSLTITVPYFIFLIVLITS